MTDLRFDQYMDTAHKMIKSGKFNKDKGKDTIYDQMTGRSLPYGLKWSSVDEVLFPIMSGDDHWVTGRFIFKDKSFYVYNSYPKRHYKNLARATAEKYAEVIPFYIDAFGIFNKRKDLLQSEAYKDVCPTKPLKVELCENIPEQNGADCGVFALSYMEYIIEDKEFPSEFNVQALRTRLAFSLYKHGMKKREDNVDTDDEEIVV